MECDAFQSIVGPYSMFFSATPCGDPTPFECTLPFIAGCCDVSTYCMNVADSSTCGAVGGTFSSGEICCQAGTCAVNAAACPGGLAGAPDGEGAPLALVPVPSSYAEYAHTLCRVLNECGDGDESLCLDDSEHTAEARLACVDTGCCAVSEIP